MLKKLSLLFYITYSISINAQTVLEPQKKAEYFYKTSKPYTRWWWFASVIKKEDIKQQLDWVKQNNFGGVEVAFLYPYSRIKTEKENTTSRIEWLGSEWTEVVAYTKKYADSIGIGCDFTFGTGWPFGDIYTPLEDATQKYNDTSRDYKKTYPIEWHHAQRGYIINHLDKNVLHRYSQRMGKALAPALKGTTSGLFCDSWEVPSEKLWTTGFDKKFQKKFGYDIKPFMDSIYAKDSIDARYDYMKMLSDYVIEEFYKPFTEECNELGSFSRAQCSGAPCDLMTAYSVIDVPEGEAMLYEPNFSKIVGSAACLSSKKEITSETFTCMYGFPKKYMYEEQTADLKLVADAMFANGVNHIIWHGMPYNPAGIDTFHFYATIHVGAKGNLAKDIPTFNNYMEKVSSIMKKGKTYSDVAVYIPMEDGWIAGEYPKELQTPGAWSAFELRYIQMPVELKGYHPLWINHHFLKNAELINNQLHVGDAVFNALYIDVNYLDSEALTTILNLAKKGFPVCIKRMPKEPGKIKSVDYKKRLAELMQLKNVSKEFKKVHTSLPLVQGKNVTDFWCKKDGDVQYIFFSHPMAQNLHYPMGYGQSFCKKDITQKIIINTNGKSVRVKLKFKPYQSLLLKIDKNGAIEFVDINYQVPVPVTKKD